MRKIRVIIFAAIVFVILAVAVTAAGFADAPADGWSVGADGVLRYYSGGHYVTGVNTVGGYTYEFGEDGAYKGLYDGHVSIGTAGVPCTDVYRNALKALGASNIYGYYSFEHSETYQSTSFKESEKLMLGDRHNQLDKETVQQRLYTKNDFFTSSGSAYLLEVQRYATDTVHERTAGNYALEVKSTVTGGTGYIHTYLDVMKKITPNTEVVIECEIKLGKNFSYAASLFQVIDRANVDTGANFFLSLLNINKDGGVYYSNNDSHLLCVLNRNEYTRISVSVHPSDNTVDVYINGILVAEGLTYISDDKYDPKNFEIETVRFARFDAIDSGSMFIDNFAMYKAEKPVCTAIAEPKNGVFAEGGVVRCYENNLIAIGSKQVTGEFFGKRFEKEVMDFGDIQGNGLCCLGNNARTIVNGAVLSDTVIMGNVFTVPAAVAPDKGAFGGWRITDGQTVRVLSPGETYVMNGDITCEAVEIELSMVDGASIKIGDGTSTALRFMARIDRKDYDATVSAGVTVEMRMLIVPTEYFDKTYGYYTAEALNALGVTDYLDIKADGWYSESDNYYYYTCSTGDIIGNAIAKSYSAVAYMKLTFADGTESLAYAEHDAEKNSRSVYWVAHAAYNDRTAVKEDGYANKIKFSEFNTYSPYKKEKLASIKKYADTVIVVSSEGDTIKSAGDFYAAPYSVNSQLASNTGKNDISVSPKKGWEIANTCLVVYNGRELDKNEYSISEGVCRFSVDALKEDITELVLPEEKEGGRWYLFDPKNTVDGTYFSGVSYDEKYINTSQKRKASFYLNFGHNVRLDADTIANFGSNENGKARYTAYQTSNGKWFYDLSDWKMLTFWVWSDKPDQSIYLKFDSENPNVSGVDYYGRTFVLTQGWNYIAVNKEQMGSARSPLGWDKIEAVHLMTDGWGMVNDLSGIAYVSEMTFYDSVVSKNVFADSRLSDAVIFADGGLRCGVNGRAVVVSSGGDTAFEKDGVYYLSAAAVAAVKGDGVGYYYHDEGLLSFYYGGKNYLFRQGKTEYTEDGVAKTLKYSPIKQGGALFLSADDLMSVFGYAHKYVDRMGVVVLSNTANIFDAQLDYNTLYELAGALIYARPTGEQIVSDLNEHSGGKHPYLMINNDGFDRLRYYLQMDDTMKAYVAKLEASYGIGSSKFKAIPNTYRLTDGLRLLAISRDVMEKTISWALLAKLYEFTDSDRSMQYAERCWQEIEAACNFKNPKNGLYSWHPEICLDTSELAYPVAICYDWLYDYWVKTDSELNSQYEYDAGTTRRTLMEDSLYWMALSTLSSVPNDTTGKYESGNNSLAGYTNNWNGVCNGGMIAAALAICNVDRYAENVKAHLEVNVFAIENGMWVYAPDGGYEEGPGYWSYGTTYTQVFISCLDSACGTDYGTYNAPGFAKSVYFTTYMGAKNTSWGFHDGGSGSADTSVASWFAKKSNDPNVNAIRRQAIDNGWKAVSKYDIMYFDPHLITANITLGLDAYYSLDPTMTFRSNWDASGSIMAGLHGGDNAASHGDLDIGNFVINVNGVFMINDLGGDAYNIAGYFGGYRWSYYRKRAEGQNTLVMIPSRTNVKGNGWNGKTGIPSITDEVANAAGNTNLPTPDQNKTAVSKMLRYETGQSGAIGIVDMAPAYNEMTSGKRGLWFTDDRSTIVIQDEAKFSEKMDVWWFAHTEGDITISEDGRSAVIVRSGIVLYAEIVTDMTADVRFTEMDAVSLDKNYVGDSTDSDYYTDDIERSRSAVSKLCVTVDDVTELKLAVVFKVIDSALNTPESGAVYSWKNMDEWAVE